MAFEDFIASAKAEKVGNDSVNIDGTRYSYDILPASFAADVPYFVGFPDEKYLFISEQVRPSFRKAVLSHEVKCAAARKAGVVSYCACAVDAEMRFVPGDLDTYLQLRLEMFEALLVLYKDTADTSFLAEITKSRDRIKSRISK